MGRNSAYFRSLNDRIAETAQEVGFEGFVPLLCECPDPRCFRLVRVTLAEYEALRERADRLVVFPGHENAEAERVLAAIDRYTLVEPRRESCGAGTRTPTS